MGSGQQRVLATLNKKKLAGLTLYGACGKPLREPVSTPADDANAYCLFQLFMLAENTSNVEAKRFYEKLVKALINPYQATKSYLLWDQHPSHKSQKTKDIYAQKFRLLEQPPASSQFNCQETVWSQVKAKFQKTLHRRTHDIQDQEQLKQFLLSVVATVEIDTDKILRANLRFVQMHTKYANEQQ